MWLWIVAVLLIAGIWVAGWLLALSLVLRIVLTAVVVLLVVGVILLRRWRAVRAARALENEILKQAELQAATARPDRRAEILALREQMKQGLAALKQSKLAVSSGGGALYSLPWYMIVGPPGAGKTTALRHSGLVFPFLDPSRGGLQGLGGTRNCDWWFTNEAVILDTAGRYATAEDDRDEWFAFLDLLKKHRAKAPINGMIVAVSLTDIAGASEEQVEQMARILRSRLDEVIGRLQMVVPVYLMFTKTDLIAGFVEFWEDLRKSERAQIWGASFALAANGDLDHAKAFEAEFDVLVEQLHGRSIDRMRTTRRVEARAKVLQFPVEFAALRQNLSGFIGTLFQKNAYQETPLFRGAYFTSGTQEGRPLDRVMADMARAFGLGLGAQDAAPVVEPKSYFLTDLFQKVMFPDQQLAVRTAVEARRRLLLQVGFGTAALLLATLILVPALVSYFKNRTLVQSTSAIAAQTALVDPADRTTLHDRILRLSELNTRLGELGAWERDGAPWSYRFGMYTGSTLRPAVRDQFAANMDVSFVRPVKRVLEERLAGFYVGGRAGDLKPEVYARYYNTLKAYLMLTEQEHLDVDWATPLLVQDWDTHLRLEQEDKPSAESLVRSYLLMQKSGEIKPAARDTIVVEQARSQLRSMPRLLGDYSNLMDRVRPGTAPITRTTIFGGTSADRFVFSKSGVEVDGVYTRLGWARVREELKKLADTLRGEIWVLGDGAFDPDKAVADVRSLYFLRFSDAWEKFLLDLDVRKPANVDEALPELMALTEPEWPYLRLVRTLNDNVAIELTDEEAGKEKSLVDNAKELAEKARALAAADAGALLAAPPKNVSPMERNFRALIKFAVPPPPAKPDDPPAETALSQYEGYLRKLVGALTDHKQKGADARGDIKALEAEFQQAYQATVQLVAGLDNRTRELIQYLLLKPITLSWSSVISDAAGVSGAFWEMSVYRACDAKILGRYPFDPSSSRDATVEDFADFFRPTDGVLWGFYDQNLKTAIEKRGDSYVPAQRFEQRNPYSSTFLDFLKRSDEISGAMFNGDGKAPGISFSINLHSVSPEVSEVTFEIDGATHTYKNTPEDWMSIAWPATDSKVRGAKIRVRGFSGLVEEIPRMGDFGLFRLLAEASIKPGTAGGKPDEVRTLVATWTIKSQHAVVQMDIRPSRSDNPFRKDFFSNYRCPSIITEGSR